ncbi:phosphatidylglycerophosphatase A [Rickettsiales bacterium]|nr:phosphatidylglycerophosphatase A [Rickettsiales bacterium]
MNKFILTFFYIGLIKKAPGTFGSFAAVIFWILVNYFLPKINIFWPIFLIIITLYGCIFIKNYSRGSYNIDDKSIVIDEVLGQILTLEVVFYYFNLEYNIFNQSNILIIFLCFMTFRFFDIIKIFPINIIDQKFKTGFGVMLDDLMAAIFAIICSIIIITAIL